MTAEEQVVSDIREYMDNQITPEEKTKIEYIARNIRQLVSLGGPEGKIALALVGAEEAAAA